MSMTVENTGGEKLGKIVDVVYDQKSGKVRYAAVCSAAFSASATSSSPCRGAHLSIRTTR